MHKLATPVAAKVHVLEVSTMACVGFNWTSASDEGSWLFLMMLSFLTSGSPFQQGALYQRYLEAAQKSPPRKSSHSGIVPPFGEIRIFSVRHVITISTFSTIFLWTSNFTFLASGIIIIILYLSSVLYLRNYFLYMVKPLCIYLLIVKIYCFV